MTEFQKLIDKYLGGMVFNIKPFEDLLMNKYEITKEDVKYINHVRYTYYIYLIFKLLQGFNYLFDQEEFDNYCGYISLSYAHSLGLEISDKHLLKFLTTEYTCPTGMKSTVVIEETNLLTDDLKIRCIKIQPAIFKYIENPSIYLQNFAVRYRCHLIRYIKDPDVSIQLAAVKLDARMIKYIKDPHPDVVNYDISIKKTLEEFSGFYDSAY